MDLLVLESADGAPVAKSSSSKLVGTLTSNVTQSPENKKLNTSRRFIGSSGQISPTRLGMNSPTAGTPSVTTLAETDKEKDILYPFKITHSGLDTFTLYTFSPHDKDRPARLGRDKAKRDRESWKDNIVNTKKEYSSTMYTMNSEPFRLRVLADYAFGYDSSSIPHIPVFTPGTVIDRAIREAESRMVGLSGTNNDSNTSSSAKTDLRPLINSPINCGVSFVYADGNEYCLLGLDFGVYIHDKRVGSAWKRCLRLLHVTQINIVQDMNIAVILSDKTLAYYHLDVLINQAVKGDNASAANKLIRNDNDPKGYKLSERNVSFFSVGLMRERTLLFYKKNDGLSSVFKVLEPIREKGSQKKRSKVLFSHSTTISSTEYFKDVDKFYTPTESYGISLFKSTFAVHTTNGFELMSLETKSTPRSLPSIGPNALANILRISKGFKYSTTELFKKKIESSKPMGMFRIAAEVIILCYEDFVIYVDNDGNLREKSPAFSYLGKAKKICTQLPYIIIFGEEIIEVRRVDRAGQLKQVITGKDIRCIDTKEGQIKAALAHPTISGRQLVVELIGNDFVVEDDKSSLSGL